MSRHASPIHWHISSSDGFFWHPPALSSWIPSAIHAIHFCLTLSLNGVFKQTSKGCNTEVNPPGITAKSVFSLLNECLTCSVLWASKESRTKRLLRLPSPPIRDCHTFLIPLFMIFSSIQIAICVVKRWKKSIGYCFVPECNHAHESHTCTCQCLQFFLPYFQDHGLLRLRNSSTVAMWRDLLSFTRLINRHVMSLVLPLPLQGHPRSSFCGTTACACINKWLPIIVYFRDYSATSMERQVKFLAVIKLNMCMLDFLYFFTRK